MQQKKYHILYEFENLALSTNPDKKIETELSDIMDVIDENKMINSDETKNKFWNMFIIDALIGNTDRHNENWGFLVNTEKNEIEFSPIYDCGFCLNPMLEDEELAKLNDVELKNLAINCYSCIKEHSKKINYMTFLKQMANKECNDAIRRTFEKIKIKDIYKFIDEIEEISDVRKNFYKKIIEIRYKILKEVYKKLN